MVHVAEGIAKAPAYEIEFPGPVSELTINDDDLAANVGGQVYTVGIRNLTHFYASEEDDDEDYRQAVEGFWEDVEEYDYPLVPRAVTFRDAVAVFSLALHPLGMFAMGFPERPKACATQPLKVFKSIPPLPPRHVKRAKPQYRVSSAAFADGQAARPS
jgi:hypothetical protein